MSVILVEDDITALLAQFNAKYTICGEIGKGGQKKVYKIQDHKGEFFALKIINTGIDSLARIKREMLAVNIISHDNVPMIFETNVNDETASNELVWVIEEFIDGVSLRQMLDEKYKFSLSEVVDLIEVILSILARCEEKKIIHRDIKPENIIVDKSNKIWLIDFGISRHLDLESLTKTGSPFGPCTVGYSACEQYRNRKKEIDIRADLFSLGVVIAEMIIGNNPYVFGETDIIAVLKKMEQQPLPLLRINGDSQYLLARFIKMLGDNRISRRPSSVSDAIELFKIIKPTLEIKER